MHTIKITVAGKTVELSSRPKVAFDLKATQKKQDQQQKARDEADKWPSQPRQAEAMLQSRLSDVPRKADAKGRNGHRTKASDPRRAMTPLRGVGVGSNTVRGVRAYAGMLRAIAAADTGCIAWETGTRKSFEARLRAHMTPTTRRDQTGMQILRRQP